MSQCRRCHGPFHSIGCQGPTSKQCSGSRVLAEMAGLDAGGHAHSAPMARHRSPVRAHTQRGRPEAGRRRRPAPGGVEAGGDRGAQLVAGDEHRAGAQRAQMAHERHVVVGLDRVADEAVQAGQRGAVRGEVGADARLAVQVERALLHLACGARWRAQRLLHAPKPSTRVMRLSGAAAAR